MSEYVLITGANRGIGLALTEQYLEFGDCVAAATRHPEAESLLQLKETYPQQLLICPCEVTSDAAVAEMVRSINDQWGRLDCVINMAGIMSRPHDQPLEKLDFAQCVEAFEVNSLGPLRVARACLPLLRQGRKPRIVNITSGCGSLSGKDNGEFYAYAASKAALNMLSRTIAFEFKREGICCVALDPGWVRTELGGPDAHLAPEESAAAIRRTVSSLTMHRTSSFLLYDGSTLRW